MPLSRSRARAPWRRGCGPAGDTAMDQPTYRQSPSWPWNRPIPWNGFPANTIPGMRTIRVDVGRFLRRSPAVSKSESPESRQLPRCPGCQSHLLKLNLPQRSEITGLNWRPVSFRLNVQPVKARGHTVSVINISHFETSLHNAQEICNSAALRAISITLLIHESYTHRRHTT